VITDRWPGLEAFFAPGRELICADRAEDVLAALDMSDQRLARIGGAARARVLSRHTAESRAIELERHVAGLAVLR
jgi:spore maturation protein CgeB